MYWLRPPDSCDQNTLWGDAFIYKLGFFAGTSSEKKWNSPVWSTDQSFLLVLGRLVHLLQSLAWKEFSERSLSGPSVALHDAVGQWLIEYCITRPSVLFAYPSINAWMVWQRELESALVTPSSRNCCDDGAPL